MPKLPNVTGKEVVRRLKRLGFDQVRQRGSHVVMRNNETRATTTVPIHPGKTVKKGTLRAILSQARVSVEEFIEAA